jgi:hypothetical protein
MMPAAVLIASWLAQAADPARAPPEPPGPPEPRAPVDHAIPDPANALGVEARFAYRLATEGPGLGPNAGFSLGASYERRYGTVAGLALGAAVDLYYDQFTTGVVGSTMVEPGVEQTFNGERLLSQTSFAVMQKAALPVGRARPWLAAGAGVTIGYFSSPEIDLRPGQATVVQPLARAAAGVDVTVRGRAGVVVRADYTRVLTHPSFTTDLRQTYRPFGDLVDVGAGLLYRF